MPRKAKEEVKIEKEKVVKKSNSVSKKVSDNSANKKTTKKSTTTKKSEIKNTKNISTSKKSATSTTKKKETPTKKASKTTKKATTKQKKLEIIEYYDLPYRYNKTIVKILAQTPNTLFVYWDISDEDRKEYTSKYGEDFFNNSKPVLKIYNKTNNTQYEIDINDFANSWYLNVLDSNCEYQIELGRRPINKISQLENNYLFVTSSNEIETPNDRILFDHLTQNIYFRNVKTNITTKRNIASLSLLKKIANISDIRNFYKKLYPNEEILIDRFNLTNPSSGNL